MTAVNEKKLRIAMIIKDVYNLSELSALTGISRFTLAGYLKGKSPYTSSYLKLCTYLDVEPEDLIVSDQQEEVENNGSSD